MRPASQQNETRLAIQLAMTDFFWVRRVCSGPLPFPRVYICTCAVVPRMPLSLTKTPTSPLVCFQGVGLALSSTVGVAEPGWLRTVRPRVRLQGCRVWHSGWYPEGAGLITCTRVHRLRKVRNSGLFPPGRLGGSGLRPTKLRLWNVAARKPCPRIPQTLKRFQTTDAVPNITSVPPKPSCFLSRPSL